MRFSTGLVLLGTLVPAVAVAQDEPPAESDSVTIAEVPFGIGERMDYRVKFGPLKVGQAYMEVEGLDTIDDNATYHLRFHMSGSVPFYKLDDTQQSWLDVALLATRRYHQDSHQGSYERYREYEFHLEQGIRTGLEGETDSIPEMALDEAAFIYFVRSIELEVGEAYEWNRYYRFDRNPVILQVLRRERIRVPAGEFETIVVRPIIKTGGIFAEGGEAEVYITDDDLRVPVRINTKMKVGSVVLELTEYREGQKLTPEMMESR
ncbi:MAG: DUF3108 domain-containing protein [Gemmatimonadetes bacterium]|nr:DUF3108 domain-containing protein [Gemmatimonadota bacterium]NIO32328.1 DUF3108 domain-containing protein [Gemmatimonadota bacterium]